MSSSDEFNRPYNFDKPLEQIKHELLSVDKLVTTQLCMVVKANIMQYLNFKLRIAKGHKMSGLYGQMRNSIASITSQNIVSYKSEEPNYHPGYDLIQSSLMLFIHDFIQGKDEKLQKRLAAHNQNMTLASARTPQKIKDYLYKSCCSVVDRHFYRVEEEHENVLYPTDEINTLIDNLSDNPSEYNDTSDDYIYKYNVFIQFAKTEIINTSNISGLLYWLLNIINRNTYETDQELKTHILSMVKAKREYQIREQLSKKQCLEKSIESILLSKPLNLEKVSTDFQKDYALLSVYNSWVKGDNSDFREIDVETIVEICLNEARIVSYIGTLVDNKQIEGTKITGTEIAKLLLVSQVSVYKGHNRFEIKIKLKLANYLEHEPILESKKKVGIADE